MTFSLNGREYKNLHIITYAVKLEVLDGEGTGRSKAYGWPMIRDPQGVITNLSIEIAASKSTEPDFVHLWQTCKDMGRDEFAAVRFVDPTGEVLEQNMYIVASELKYRRIELSDGTVYTDTLKINLIAEKGV